MGKAKRLITEGMWLEAKRLILYLDGRANGVDLPPSLRDSVSVTLIYVEEIDISVEGVHASLSFDGEAMPTFVPWAAVYQVASDAGHVLFTDSVPLDLCDILEQQAAFEPALESPGRARPDWLTLVP